MYPAPKLDTGEFPLMPKNFDFGFIHEPCIRLYRIEEILRETKIIDPVPSRQTLIRRIEDGTLVGKKVRGGYLVTEQSFKKYVKSLIPELSMLVPDISRKH
jgi:hypothetical protein